MEPTTRTKTRWNVAGSLFLERLWLDGVAEIFCDVTLDPLFQGQCLRRMLNYEIRFPNANGLNVRSNGSWIRGIILITGIAGPSCFRCLRHPSVAALTWISLKVNTRKERLPGGWCWSKKWQVNKKCKMYQIHRFYRFYDIGLCRSEMVEIWRDAHMVANIHVQLFIYLFIYSFMYVYIYI